MSLAVSADPLFTLAVLCVLVALSEWLARKSVLRHFGAALLVILLAAAAANLGLVPTGSTEGPARAVYDGIFAHVARAAIFWLLLGVDLRRVARAGLPMIALFLTGALGTLVGVLAGMAIIDGAGALGDLRAPVAGMFAATYTGGSINFNALALHYGVQEHGLVYVGAIAVDNIVTALWMIVGLVVPRAIARRRADAPVDGSSTTAGTPPSETGTDHDPDAETLDPAAVAVMIALGLAAVSFAERVARWWEATGLGSMPSLLVLTVLALVLAQLPWIRQQVGARVLGMFAVYLFLAVIGVNCDLTAFVRLGELGPALALLACTVVTVHGVAVYGLTSLLRLDPAVASVASQANIGGGTSAMALARSLGRADLVLPGIVMGACGTALGTFLGFLVAGLL